jgi:hypothetical protein
MSRREFLRDAAIATVVVAGSVGLYKGIDAIRDDLEANRDAEYAEKNTRYLAEHGDEMFLYAGARLRNDIIGSNKHVDPDDVGDKLGVVVGRPGNPMPLDPNDVRYAGYNANGSWYQFTPEAVEKLQEAGVDIKMNDNGRVVVNHQTINIPEELADEIQGIEDDALARR